MMSALSFISRLFIHATMPKFPSRTFVKLRRYALRIYVYAEQHKERRTG